MVLDSFLLIRLGWKYSCIDCLSQNLLGMYFLCLFAVRKKIMHCNPAIHLGFFCSSSVRTFVINNRLYHSKCSYGKTSSRSVHFNFYQFLPIPTNSYQFLPILIPIPTNSDQFQFQFLPIPTNSYQFLPILIPIPTNFDQFQFQFLPILTNSNSNSINSNQFQAKNWNWNWLELELVHAYWRPQLLNIKNNFSILFHFSARPHRVFKQTCLFSIG